MEFRVLSTARILGSGFPEASFRRLLLRDPHAIECGAESIDPKPHLLGSHDPLLPCSSSGSAGTDVCDARQFAPMLVVEVAL